MRTSKQVAKAGGSKKQNKKQKKKGATSFFLVQMEDGESCSTKIENKRHPKEVAPHLLHHP